MLKEENISLKRNTKSNININEMLIDGCNNITKKTEHLQEQSQKSRIKNQIIRKRRYPMTIT